MFLVFFLAEKVLHRIMLNVPWYINLGTKPAKRICVGEELDAPFINTEEERPALKPSRFLVATNLISAKASGGRKISHCICGFCIRVSASYHLNF